MTQEEKLDTILERTIVLEQKLHALEDRLDEGKLDRMELRNEMVEIKEAYLKTKTIVGALVFLVSCIFTVIVTFKDQVLHLLGIK